MQQENIDTYVLMDWGFPPESPFRCGVIRIRELKRLYKNYDDRVLATGTREEMIALMKLMDAAHG